MLPYVRICLVAKRPPPDGYPRDLKNLGDHIRKRRLDLGLSQKATATLLCVSVGTVYNWEKSLMAPQRRFVSRVHDFLGYCLLLPMEIRSDLVQAPILHSFGDMSGTDFFAPRQIRDRAGHAQDSIHCPS